MAFGEDLSELIRSDTALLVKHQSWERVKLSDVASVKNGFAFKSRYFGKEEGKPIVRIRDVLPGTTTTLYSGPDVEGYDVKPRDILVGMDGDFNCRRWTGRAALLNQRVCRIDMLTPDYLEDFLLYALPGYLAKINEHTSAVTVKHLSSKTMKSIDLPLPPLAEQARIVSRIDELFSDIEAGERAVERARAALSRYRKAVLKAAVTGELTADWRADNPLTETAQALLTRIRQARFEAWEKAELEKLDAKGKARPKTEKQWETFKGRYKEPECTVTADVVLPPAWVLSNFDLLTSVFRNGLSKRPGEEENQWPILRISAVREMGVDAKDVRFYPEIHSDQTTDFWVEKNDLLFTRYNGSVRLVGVCGLYRETQRVLHPDKLIKLRLASKEDNLPEWIEIAANSGVTKNFIASCVKTSAGQHGVAGGDIKRAPVPLPPLAEQREIVSRVEAALSRADAVEASLNAQTRQAQALRQAILKRAFAGELVDQDPNDEPAHELLERIMAS